MKSIEFKGVDFALFVFFVLITNTGFFLFDLIGSNEKTAEFLKGSIGNIGGVLSATFFFIWIKKYSLLKSRILIISAVTIGLILYEFIQLLLPWMTFDVNDILGSIIGAVIALVINLVISILNHQMGKTESNIDS